MADVDVWQAARQGLLDDVQVRLVSSCRVFCNQGVRFVSRQPRQVEGGEGGYCIEGHPEAHPLEEAFPLTLCSLPDNQWALVVVLNCQLVSSGQRTST